LDPEDAAALAGTAADPCLRGEVTWRRAGTQKIDGHWRLLRQRVATRGWNTSDGANLRRAVRTHQWRLWRTPSADLFFELGATLRRHRELLACRDEEAMEAAAAAEADDVRPRVALGRRLLQQQADRAAAAERRRVRAATASAATAAAKAAAGRPKAEARPKGRPRKAKPARSPNPEQ
jgi:hypothetical protein